MAEYLRAKTNGIILHYDERLANHPDWEAVTEQEAFPERFAPVDLKVRDKKVDLTIPAETVIAPPAVSVELSKQKGRTFGTVGEVQAVKPSNKPAEAKAPSADVTGFKGEF